MLRPHCHKTSLHAGITNCFRSSGAITTSTVVYNVAGASVLPGKGRDEHEYIYNPLYTDWVVDDDAKEIDSCEI